MVTISLAVVFASVISAFPYRDPDSQVNVSNFETFRQYVQFIENSIDLTGSPRFLIRGFSHGP